MIFARWFKVTVVVSLLLCEADKDASAGTYTTAFPLAENPISEGGNWINGGPAGLDWTNEATSVGLAHGTMNGQVKYADSTALLTGTWGSNQTATATIHVGTRPTSGNYIELEFRLRSKLSAHSNTGYEINYSMAGSSVGPYAQIVRWNGALGAWTLLDSRGIPQIADGTVVQASIVGNTITTYINGVALYSVTDNTFKDGNPGIGSYLEGSGQNDSGFTQFSVTDGITPLAAGFAGSPTNGIAHLTVAFTNLSSGATSYAWAFGDGQNSTSVNPSHTYTNPGAYSISLTAVGPGGTNVLTLTNYIAVAAPPPMLSAHMTNGQFNLFFEAAAGQSYSVQQNTNLVTTNWNTLTNFEGAGLPYQFGIPATSASDFFRTREP